MAQIGRTIYYDNTTGNVLVDTGEKQGDVIQTTTQQDFGTYPGLGGVQQSTVGALELEYGEYATEYLTSYISNVDPTSQAVTWAPCPAPPATDQTPTDTTTSA